MKKLFGAIVISLILALVVSGSGLAALPGTGWWTGYSVQNLSDTTGNISMQAYKSDTADVYGSSTFPYASHTALVYNPSVTTPSGNQIAFTTPLPAGFVGSVVLSSNVPAGSVVEVANYPNGTLGTVGGTAAGMYQGVSGEDVATTLFAPTIKHNYSGQTTTLYVQAAGAAVHATINYTMADGGTYSQTLDIAANKMVVFDPVNAGVPSTSCGTSTLTSPCYGTATITSTTGPMAGVLVEHAHTGSPANIALSVRLATPNDKSPKVYAPSIKFDYITSTGMCQSNAVVMNTGTGNANVKITLTVTAIGSGGSTATIGQQFVDYEVLAPGENANFSQWNMNLGGLPTNTMAAAVIESVTEGGYAVQTLIGSGNDSKNQAEIPGGKAKIKYALFSDTAATPYAAAARVKEFLGIWTGGITIQNVGTAADTVHVVYYEYGTTNSYHFWTKTPLAVGAAINTASVSVNGGTKFNNDGTWTFASLAGKQFSAIAYTTGGQDVIVLVAENTPDGTMDISRYEGVNY